SQSAERCTSAWDLCVVQDSIPAELGNVGRMLVDVSCFWTPPYDLTLVANVSFVCVSCEQALFIRTVRTGFPLTISHELPILGMRAAVMPGIRKGSWVPTCHRHIACFPLTSSHLLPTPGYNAVRLELGAEAETQPAFGPVKVSGRVRRGHNGRRSSRRTRRSPASAWPGVFVLLAPRAKIRD